MRLARIFGTAQYTTTSTSKANKNGKKTCEAARENAVSRMVTKIIASRPPKLFRRPSDLSVSTATTVASSKCERHVRFASRVSTHKTIARGDYTQDEQNAIWFSHEDFNGIGQACSKQIQKMDNGESLLDKKYCTRGLEQHTRVAIILKTKSRAESINAVLKEQELQSQQGVHDAGAIANVYHDVTSSCQLWANEVGLRDEREAEALLVDDDEFEELLPLASGATTTRE